MSTLARRAAPLLVTLALPILCFAQAPCFDWTSGFASQGIDSPTSISSVNALLVWDDGSGAGQRLYAGGHFTSIGGVSANNLAAWDGSMWHAVSGGLTGFPAYLPYMGAVPDEVDSLCIHDDGFGPALWVGGAYTFAGGQNCRGISKWNGSTWTGIPGVEAMAMAMGSFDDGAGPALYVSGFLLLTGTGTNHPALRWRGGSWETFAAPPENPTCFRVFDDGSGTAIYAGGGVAGSVAISKWNGAQWTGVGGGFDAGVNALCVHDDGGGPKLYAGGSFTLASGAPAAHVARWDGTSWSALGAGVGGEVTALASFPDGFGGPPRLIAAGSFATAGGAPASRIAAWDGTSWSPLGAGLGSTAAKALAVYDDGLGSGRDLYAGGGFATAGGQPVSRFAKWEGCGGTGTPFCPGDGSLVSACPCANSGAAGHGCASSQVAAGALLVASGHPSPDTIVLAASDMRPGVTCIFLQGDTVISAGVNFGDGLRCVGGQLLRLSVKTATGGAASFPAVGDASISATAAALGAPIASHSSRSYQVYYRDSDPDFCPAPPGNTWNVTNAMRIAW